MGACCCGVRDYLEYDVQGFKGCSSSTLAENLAAFYSYPEHMSEVECEGNDCTDCTLVSQPPRPNTETISMTPLLSK